MESKKNILDPLESLEIIQQMVQLTKMKIHAEQGFYYLLWGWVLFIASITHILLLKTVYADFGFLSWVIFSIVGIFVSVLFSRKKWKEKKHETYLEHFLKLIFTTGILLYFIGVFICVFNGISPFPLLLLISGFYGIISGRLLTHNAFTFGGILFVLFAIIANFLGLEYQLILISIAIAIGYLIPAYTFKANAGKTE